MAASLSSYDGSAGVLVDPNIWIDCIDDSSSWHNEAINALQTCSEKSPLHVNLVIYTELPVPNPDVAAIDELLDVYDTLRSTMPWACAALAATAFATYRGRGGNKLLPLADFFIGAHAAISNLSILTRDPSGYQSYFQRLILLGG
jgi:predicted nucleic acid-binding protein